MQSLQRWSSVFGVHAGASEPPPLDDPLPPLPELPPEDPPVDASLSLPDVNAEPPQFAASASGASSRKRAEARMERSIIKPR